MREHQSVMPVEDPRRVDRVRSRTPAHVLAKIDRKTATKVFDVARQGPDAIRARIDAIDREWDIERYLTLNFVVVAGISEELGRRGNRGWLAFFRAQQVFLAMHALLGWCPPTAVFRRIGVRTQKEIDAERAVLIELYQLLREDALEVTPEVVVEEVEVVYDPDATDPGYPRDRW